MLSLAEKKEKNEELRKRIVNVNKNVGVMYIVIGDKIGMKSSSSFTQWRKGLYDFSEERMIKLEKVLENYERLLI